MCFGTYDGNGRPVITASVIVPEFKIGHEISFLIDTGADSTCISGIDAANAGLTPRDLDEDHFESFSVQGISSTEGLRINESALLGFEEYSEEHDRYSLHLEVLDQIEVLPKCPQSLLGRDMLDRFEITFDSVAEEIEMVRDDFSGEAYICIARDEEIGPGFREFTP